MESEEEKSCVNLTPCAAFPVVLYYVCTNARNVIPANRKPTKEVASQSWASCVFDGYARPRQAALVFNVQACPAILRDSKQLNSPRPPAQRGKTACPTPLPVAGVGRGNENIIAYEKALCDKQGAFSVPKNTWREQEVLLIILRASLKTQQISDSDDIIDTSNKKEVAE